MLTTKSALPGTISSNDPFSLEITGFLGRKMHYVGKISIDDLFFFRDHCISRKKVHYQEMTSSDDLFFTDHFKSRTKIGLEYIQFYDPVLAYQLHH